MQNRCLLALAVGLLFICMVVYSLQPPILDCTNSRALQVSSNTSLRLLKRLLIFVTLASHPANFNNKNGRQTADKKNRAILSIFKGREAKLNQAILLTLFRSCPLVVYDITKQVKKRKGFRFTRYTNVNRRVRALVEQGYLETAGSRNIQSGSQGTLYQPTIRAKVAFYLSIISIDQFVKKASDQALTTELAAIVLFLDLKLPQ